jgi:hypothetical protein
VDRASFNFVSKQPAINPEEALRQLRAVEILIAQSDLAPKVRALRTNKLNRDRELREAALFCYGQQCRMQQRVHFYPVEASNYDFVATWTCGDVQHYAPVQLKEVVPQELNPRSSIQAIIEGLARYSSARELVVAIHVNQEGRFDPKHLQLPRLSIAELWIFGAASRDQSKWFLFGDMLTEPKYSYFDYPL